jgi:haloalkane dehalogenase
MTAFFIAHVEIRDREAFREYERGVLRTIKPFKGWVLAAGPAERADGAEPRNHNVIIRFPTLEQAKAWWSSPAYQEIIPIRHEHAPGADALFVAGLESDAVPSALERYPKRHEEVLGKRMAYVEAGQGDPIVFLHGNPTSSYLWRNVIPHLEGLGRCIAPDLIGMGDSDKLEGSDPGRYRFVEHRRYLDALLEQLGVARNVNLVVHDWGSALGFDWANRHRGAVRGIAYMEAIVAPFPDWSDWPEAVQPVFQAFRSAVGEKLILEQNAFVEKVLPGAILRRLGDAEMNAYRRPFLAPGESRRPTLTWPREIPVTGEPKDVHEIVAAYADWLARSDVPKLFVNAEPGAILRGAQRELCRRWPNQTEITVKGSHFVQEDAPDEIGRAIADWLGAR